MREVLIPIVSSTLYVPVPVSNNVCMTDKVARLAASATCPRSFRGFRTFPIWNFSAMNESTSSSALSSRTPGFV